MTREEFMNIVHYELRSLGDCYLTDRIIDAVDKYTEEQVNEVLDKIQVKIGQLRNFKAENYNLEEYSDYFDARLIFREDAFDIINKYKAESEK